LLFDVSDKRCRHRQPEKSGILPEIRLKTQARIMRNRLQSQQPVGIEGSLKAPKRVFRLLFVFYTARQPENGLAQCGEQLVKRLFELLQTDGLQLARQRFQFGAGRFGGGPIGELLLSCFG